MQYKLILAAASVVMLAACTPAQTPSTNDGQETSVPAAADDSDSMVDSDAMKIEENDPTPSDMGGSKDDDTVVSEDPPVVQARVVPVVVTDWSFSPATVTVKKGEKVKLELKGDKGIHSLLIADLGVNVRVEPGSDTVIDLPTDTVGTFAGRCGVPCGPGHRDMAFTIVVE